MLDGFVNSARSVTLIDVALRPPGCRKHWIDLTNEHQPHSGEPSRRSHPTHFGDVAQLVRALPCHGRGRGFEPRRPRHTFQMTYGTYGPRVTIHIPIYHSLH